MKTVLMKLMSRQGFEPGTPTLVHPVGHAIWNLMDSSRSLNSYFRHSTRCKIMKESNSLIWKVTLIVMDLR